MKDDVVILIAEDDKGHFLLTKHRLKSAGIQNEILWFADGQEALDFLCGRSLERNYDPQGSYLLLLDIRMPKVDGIEILEKIKSDGMYENVPVVMVTTSDAPANISRCKELGCDGYEVKPLGKSFIETLECVCQ